MPTRWTMTSRPQDDGTSSYAHGHEDGYRAGLEEAAKVCECEQLADADPRDGWESGCNAGCRKCAARIRALVEEK